MTKRTKKPVLIEIAEYHDRTSAGYYALAMTRKIKSERTRWFYYAHKHEHYAAALREQEGV